MVLKMMVSACNITENLEMPALVVTLTIGQAAYTRPRAMQLRLSTGNFQFQIPLGYLLVWALPIRIWLSDLFQGFHKFIDCYRI